MTDSPTDHEHPVDVGLSKVCVDAIHDKLKEAFQRFAQLLIEALFGCVLGNEESTACIAATDKMDHFLDDMVAKCQREGDFCNITVMGVSDSKLVAKATKDSKVT